MADNKNNKGQSAEDASALGKAYRSLSEEQQKQLKNLYQQKEVRASLLQLAKNYADQMEETLEYLQEQELLLGKSQKFQRDFIKDQNHILSTSEKMSKLFEKMEDSQQGLASLYNQEIQSVSDLLLKQNMIATGLQDEYAQLLTTYMLESGINDLNDDRVQSLIKELQHRQHIKKEVDEQVELTESLASYMAEVREEADKLKKEYTILGAKIKAVVMDPEVRKAFMKGFLLEKTLEMGKEMTEVFGEMRKEGLTVTQTLKEGGVAIGAMFSLSGASLKENAEIMAGIAESTGNLESATSDAVAEVGKLSKTFGIAAGEAGKLYGQMKNLPGASEESAAETMKFAGNLAKAAHVAPGKVMKDMAQNSEAIALNTKNGGKDMVAVSVAAAKLGVEMSSLNKMSEGLLDFESSINKQMEASALLGREINLDKAREAALNGDILGATQEMLRNVGGEAEFNKMNVVQRKALAESMGVSVGELSKMVKNQDKLADLTHEQQEALATGEVTMDEILANSGGVAKNLFDGVTSIGGMVVGGVEFVKGMRDGLGLTKDLIGGFKEGKGLLGSLGGAAKGLFGGEKKAEIPKPEVPKVDAAADAGKKMGGPGLMASFKKNMKALASGFKEMSKPGVLQGVGVTALAGPALVVALPAIPFLLFMGLVPLKMLESNFKGLGKGLSEMSKALVGVGVFALFAPAAVIGLAALPFLTLFGLMPLAQLEMNFKGLGKGLAALDKGVVGVGVLAAFAVAGALAIPSLIFLGGIALLGKSAQIGLEALGKGLASFGNPATAGFVLIGIGLIAALGAAMIPFAFALSLVTPLVEVLGKVIVGVLGAVPPIIEAMANGFVTMFTAVSDNISSLLLLGPALMMIGAGLSVMAFGGLLAMPVIAMLIGLAAVAPALVGLGTALGGMFGGGGGGEKEDKMDILIAEIRSLKAIAASGGVVNMDGKKVGEVVRLGLNSGGTR